MYWQVVELNTILQHVTEVWSYIFDLRIDGLVQERR